LLFVLTNKDMQKARGGRGGSNNLKFDPRTQKKEGSGCRSAEKRRGGDERFKQQIMRNREKSREGARGWRSSASRG